MFLIKIIVDTCRSQLSNRFDRRLPSRSLHISRKGTFSPNLPGT